MKNSKPRIFWRTILIILEINFCFFCYLEYKGNRESQYCGKVTYAYYETSYGKSSSTTSYYLEIAFDTKPQKELKVDQKTYESTSVSDRVCFTLKEETFYDRNFWESLSLLIALITIIVNIVIIVMIIIGLIQVFIYDEEDTNNLPFDFILTFKNLIRGGVNKLLK